jgi:hypothetical protein
MPDRKRMQLENVAVLFASEPWGIPDSSFALYEDLIPISKAVLICLPAGPRLWCLIMAGDENLKVRIRNAESKYLGGDFDSPQFTDDPLKALVFDDHRHKVA